MDMYPLANGHCLVFPRIHTPSVFTLPAQAYSDTMEVVFAVGHAMSKVFPDKLVAMFTAGKEIDEHAHVHVLAITHGLKATFADLSTKPRIVSGIANRTFYAIRIRANLPTAFDRTTQ